MEFIHSFWFFRFNMLPGTFGGILGSFIYFTLAGRAARKIARHFVPFNFITRATTLFAEMLLSGKALCFFTATVGNKYQVVM